MKFNKFQQGSHFHEKGGDVKTKVIPFKKKARRAYVRPRAVSKAKVIAFPDSRARIDRMTRWWSTMGIFLESLLGVTVIIILLLMVALFFIS